MGCYWLFFLESFLHSFVAGQFDVRLYKSTVNLSIIGDESSIKDKVAWSPRLLKIGAISSNKSQTFHADPFVTLGRKGTWSHPVNAWKNESPRALDSPRLLKMTWTGAYLLCFPTPKSTQNSSNWSFKDANTETASTNTSVSTLRIIIFEWLYRDILTYKNTLRSAPSWPQVEMKGKAIWFVLVMQVVS